MTIASEHDHEFFWNLELVCTRWCINVWANIKTISCFHVYMQLIYLYICFAALTSFQIRNWRYVLLFSCTYTEDKYTCTHSAYKSNKRQHIISGYMIFNHLNLSLYICFMCILWSKMYRSSWQKPKEEEWYLGSYYISE